jgi:predicted dehydrogenase
MSVAEAEELARAAAARPRQIALIDHELRFLPSWRDARARISELGPIRYAEVRYASPGRGDRTREWNWWSDARRGGGVLGAVGSHFVDALRYFGAEFASAHAMLRTVIDQRPSDDGMREVTSDDLTAAQFKLRGDGYVTMTLSVVSTGPDEASVITLHFEQGAMRFVGSEVLLSVGRAPFATVAGGPLEQRPGNSPGGAFGTGTLHLANALREAIDEGKLEALAPAATFEDGLMQQRVLDAAREASRTGGWVDVL